MNECLCLYTKYLFTLRFTEQFVRVDLPFVVFHLRPANQTKIDFAGICQKNRHACFKILLSYKDGMLVDMKPFLCNRSPEEMVCL